MGNVNQFNFIDLRLDYAFHLVFGTPGNEDLLLKLVNAIIPGRDFTSVRLSTNEHVGLRPDSRRTVYDIFANTSDGSDVTIEMQFGDQDDFNQRLVFYSTFPVQNHVMKGEDTYTFPSVYVVGITDFIIKGVEANDDVINLYSVRNDKHLERTLSTKLTYVTVELPKLRKDLKELETPSDFMLYAIRNIGEMTEMPAEYKGQDLDKLFELCNFAAMTQAEQRQYLAEFMAAMDEKSRIRTAENKGRAEGKAEGLAEGKAEAARNLKNLGVSLDIIAEATGLDRAVVEAL